MHKPICNSVIVVNDILASCYANVLSHNLAHLIMAPLRFYYTLSKYLCINEPFHSDSNGLHWLPQIMLHLTRKYVPTAFTYLIE
ncbi:unnamed protein product [Didymodactylos carnosus]|uniref:Hedgehog protein Hint domain-containing protein n=1 Tax=Didymodactylos carnosus TaxID=1234261 RepID=A0A8S2FRV2_9BILA|nr:unnamed protein product [Didymodactylos carnosus]CAF4327046.1 unnamed protein product [Didymodactylos carnosus]